MTPLSDPVRYRLAYAFAWLTLRPLLALLGGIRVTGLENVPRQGGVILAPNHASYSDPPILGLSSPRPVWFMTKAHLFRIPLLGPLMRLYQAFPVAVDGVDREAIRTSEKLLERGVVLCVFPEGAVSNDGRLQPLKPGPALLALRTGAPLVPVGLARTQRLLPPTRWLPGFVRGGVEVRFGPPLNVDDLPEGLKRDEQLAVVTERLERALIPLLPPDQQPDPPSYPGEGAKPGMAN